MKFNRNVFMPFVVLGDPDYETSVKIVKTLVDNGAGALELGLAFGDSIADGPTVCKAHCRALSGGITLEKEFEIISDIRKYTKIPISLMTAANIPYTYGLDKFYKRCANAGVDSVLCPDVPLEESSEFCAAATKHSIHQITIVAPTTGTLRMTQLANTFSSGYVYLVSRQGVTGEQNDLDAQLCGLIRETKKYFSIPVYVGFGISRPEHVSAVLKYLADGAICGSAFCSIIETYSDDKRKMISQVGDLCKRMVDAVKSL